jgi:hypothetical protein
MAYGMQGKDEVHKVGISIQSIPFYFYSQGTHAEAKARARGRSPSIFAVGRRTWKVVHVSLGNENNSCDDQ